MPKPRKDVEGASAPSTIRILEDKTIAHGTGLLTVRKDTIISDPWIVNAVVTNNIDHAVLE